MQAVNAHIKQVPVLVNQLDGLLHVAAYFDGLQTAKFADTVVNMGYEISYF